jgi:exopolysaccharide biosynthesis protein
MANELKTLATMIMKRFSMALVAVFLAASAIADWQNVAPGVDFQEFRESNYDIFVTRIDLTNDAIRVIASRESERGMKVSDFARKVHAIAAINGDYFDDKFNPIGMTVGPCGEWDNAKRTKREGYVAISTKGEGKIARQTDVSTSAPAETWMAATISGWPALINNCDALSAGQLPGSDAFTRSPHPRTAVGLSDDRKTLYFVVADGRRTGVPGLTLAQLGSFMASRLDACSAINFDGGGSTAMWVSDRVVNRPADGVERPVGDHLAVILQSDLQPCDPAQEAKLSALRDAALNKGAIATITTTTTTTRTTVTTTATQKPQTSSPAPNPPHR